MGVFTGKRLRLETVVHAIHFVRVIGEMYDLSDGTINIFCSSKGIARLLLGIRYQSVTLALDDNGDLLAELNYQLKRLDKIATIKFPYCDLDAKTGDDIPRQYIADLGTELNTSRVALSLPLPESSFINPPHNAVQFCYNGRPFLTKIKSTIRQDMYLASIQATICKQ